MIRLHEVHRMTHMQIPFNEFRSRLKKYQPRINAGEIIELTTATCRFRQEFEVVAYAVQSGMSEQLPRLPIVPASSVSSHPKQAIELVKTAGGCVVRGKKTGDRFVLLSPALYDEILGSKGSEIPAS